MTFLYLVCAFVLTLPLTRADYSCMCAFHHKLPVYNEASNNSKVVGRLTSYECKATYGYYWKYHPSALWVSIQYQNHVGYVAKGHGNVQIRTCPSSPSASDTVSPPLLDPYTTASLPPIPTTTVLQYECLCNYHGHRVAVHPTPTKSSGAMGYLSQFDCKPTHRFTSTDANWKPIQYEKHVGYVFLSEAIQVRRCPGNPPSVDMVPTPKSTTSTSTSSGFTTSLSMPTSVSRRTLASRSSQKVWSSTSTSSMLPGSSPTNTANVVRSKSEPGTILGVPRQKPNNAKDMSTQNTSTKQSTKQCINKPTHLEKDESIDKGTVAGLVLAAFLVGLLGGAVAVLMFVKRRTKTAEKYEVWFKNEATDPKAVLHVK